MLSDPNASTPKPASPFPQLFSGMLALSIALVGSAYLAGNALRSLRSNDILTVIGSSTRPIRSDFVIWRSSVSSQQTTLPLAYQELKRYNERVRAYLKSKNVPDDAIVVSAIETQPKLDKYPEPRKTAPRGQPVERRTFKITGRQAAIPPLIRSPGSVFPVM